MCMNCRIEIIEWVENVLMFKLYFCSDDIYELMCDFSDVVMCNIKVYVF